MKPDTFTYNEFVKEYDDEFRGTVCCPAGWLPDIYPEEWEWHYSSKSDSLIPRYTKAWRIIEDETTTIKKELMLFFEIDLPTVEALFFGSVTEQRKLSIPEAPAAPQTTLSQVTNMIEVYYTKYIK